MKRSIMFAVALLGFLTLVASATIINVPGDYPTIQQGINAAGPGADRPVRH